MSDILENLQHNNYGYCDCGLRLTLLVREAGVSSTYPQEGWKVYDHKVMCSSCDVEEIRHLEEEGWYVVGW